MQQSVIKIIAEGANFEVVQKQLKDLQKTNDDIEKKAKDNHSGGKKRHEETIDWNTKLTHSFKELGEGIVAAFAVEKILEFGAECIKAFEEADAAAKDLEFTVKNLAGGTSDSVEELSVKSEDLAKSLQNLFTKKELDTAAASLLKMNLTIEQTSELMPILADVAAKANKPLQEVVQAVGKGISEGRMSGELTNLGIKFSNVGDMADRFNSALNGLKKYKGAAIGSLDEISNQAKESANDIEESQVRIGSALAPKWESTKKFLLSFIDPKTWRSADEVAEEIKDESLKKEKQRIYELQRYEHEQMTGESGGGGGDTKGFSYLKKLNNEELNIRKENAENNLKEEILAQDKIIGVKKQYGQLDLNREAKEIDKELEERKKGYDSLVKLRADYEKKLNEFDEKGDNEAMALSIQRIKDETEKNLAEEELSAKKQFEALQKQKEEFNKIAHDKSATPQQKDRALQDINEINKTIEEAEKTHQFKLDKIHTNASEKEKKEWDAAEAKKIQDADKANKESLEFTKQSIEYEKDVETTALKRKLADKKITLENYNEEVAKLQLKADEDTLEAEQNAGVQDLKLQTKIADEKIQIQKQTAKQIQDVITQVSDISESVFNNMTESVSNNINVLDGEMQYQNSVIEEQRLLAQNGMANDLAFEEKHAADLEKQKIQQQKKLASIKEWETFMNSVAKFSETDPKTAIPKALAILAATKAAEAIYAEEGGIIGMNNKKSYLSHTGLSRKHTSGNDVLLHAERGEGIIPVKNMQAWGLNSSTQFDSFLKNPFSAKINTVSKPVYVNDNSSLVKEVQELQQIVKNKKETHLDIQGIHEWIETTIEDGISKQLRIYNQNAKRRP